MGRTQRETAARIANQDDKDAIKFNTMREEIRVGERHPDGRAISAGAKLNDQRWGR